MHVFLIWNKRNVDSVFLCYLFNSSQTLHVYCLRFTLELPCQCPALTSERHHWSKCCFVNFSYLLISFYLSNFCFICASFLQCFPFFRFSIFHISFSVYQYSIYLNRTYVLFKFDFFYINIDFFILHFLILF